MCTWTPLANQRLTFWQGRINVDTPRQEPRFVAHHHHRAPPLRYYYMHGSAGGRELRELVNERVLFTDEAAVGTRPNSSPLWYLAMGECLSQVHTHGL